jgi:hypothetical protein
MALEAALFVLIVALPLAFFPQSRDAFLDVKDPAARRRQAPEAWIRDQLATFPNDSVTVPARGALPDAPAYRRGPPVPRCRSTLGTCLIRDRRCA